jgi:3-dehydroquinate dehydratase-2
MNERSRTTHNRVEVMHGVNLDMLGERPREHYGDLGLDELVTRVKRFARELDLEVRFFLTDGVVLNPGAWTHYSWAIRDALELTGLPAVEVHLSDLEKREDWRRNSVLDGLVIEAISGKGPDGYRDALAVLKEAIEQ